MEIFLDMFYKLVDLAGIIYDFIFTEFEILGYVVSLWELLAGSFFAILFISWITKKLVPAV